MVESFGGGGYGRGGGGRVWIDPRRARHLTPSHSGDKTKGTYRLNYEWCLDLNPSGRYGFHYFAGGSITSEWRKRRE